MSPVVRDFFTFILSMSPVVRDRLSLLREEPFFLLEGPELRSSLLPLTLLVSGSRSVPTCECKYNYTTNIDLGCDGFITSSLHHFNSGDVLSSDRFGTSLPPTYQEAVDTSNMEKHFFKACGHHASSDTFLDKPFFTFLMLI